MKEDFLGKIGGLEFVTGAQAFKEAVQAQKEGHFGKPEPKHSKIYILIKDWVDVGHAVNTAGHASLILYLRNKDNAELQDWAINSFRKVTCKVSEKEFEKAKEYGGFEIVTEMAFDQKEVALAFLPRKEWPKFFKFLKLYGKD